MMIVEKQVLGGRHPIRGLWCRVWDGDELRDRGHGCGQAGWDLDASPQLLTLGGDGHLPFLASHAKMVASTAVTAPRGVVCVHLDDKAS